MSIEKQKITEINNIILKKYKVIGFVNNEYKNSNSKCIVECKIHGNSSEWGNPWYPSFYLLKSGLNCPKCMKNYKFTEQEVLAERNLMFKNKYKIIGFLNNEYKNNNSKCIVECKIHGNGNEWGTPWNPTVSKLKSGRNCPKCMKKYKFTEQEIIEELNHKLKDRYKIIGFVDGKYKNINSKCIVECKIHGNGNKWGNPWTPTVYSLKFGNNCPKCVNRYKHTEQEILKELNSELKNKYKISGFVNNVYKDSNSKCIIECKVHGNGGKWGTPWNPTVSKLRAGENCPKCVNRYKYTEQEIVEELNHKLKDKYKIIGLVNEIYKDSNSKCIVECKVHGNGSKWGNPWTPTVYSLKSGNNCPKCMKNYKYTEQEVLEELNINLKDKYKIIGFVNNNYKNSNSKCVVECKVHGNGSKWGNPWNPTVSKLRTGINCPKCIDKYEKTEQEAVEELNFILKDKYKIIGFIDGKYKNINSRCIIECKMHGNGSKWKVPWIPTVLKLKQGRGCPKCANKYKYSYEEVIDNVNQILTDNLKIIGFVDDIYKNENSRCIMQCKIHGDANKWKNPWNPRVGSLRGGNGCPKCSQKYKYTEQEILEELNFNYKDRYEIIGFVGGRYKNIRSRCIMECKIHGNGDLFEEKWNPTIANLKKGKGCPFCAIEGRELGNCLKNIKQFNYNRILYFIKFENLQNKKIFYKIGVSSENGVLKRYPISKLKKDNIKIVAFQEIKTNNIKALIAEYWALRHFSEDRKMMLHVLKSSCGGTECFSKDITKIMPLEDIIEKSSNELESILEIFGLSNKEKKEALFAFNRINDKGR